VNIAAILRPLIHVWPLAMACGLAWSQDAGEMVTQTECTVILQTRPDRLYCYATNRPFRVMLREPARFAHGEQFVAEGKLVVTNLVEDVPTLVEATVRRLGRTNVPPPMPVTPADLATGKLNFHRVVMRGRVTSHEWMYFLNRHIEIVVAEGEGRSFRVNVLGQFSNARQRMPVGTEVDFLGLSFLEVFAQPRGPEVQIDVENLDECRVVHPAPWLTLDVARKIGIAGVALGCLGGLWLVRERRQIGRLRGAERAVRQLNTTLEHRIDERTAELVSANERLQANAERLHQAEEELLRALSQERELSQLKTRFVSMVSHELRNPLGVVMCSADILANYLDELPEEERAGHLQAIHDSAARMAELMEEVLLLGRVDAGRIPFIPAPLDLGALCRRTVEQTTLATGRRCPVEIESPRDAAGAEGDENLINHILTNLLTNAVKYSAPGTPVRLSVHRENGHAVFTVMDRGIGIREQDRPHLFDAFYRGSNTSDVPGTGLGLVIARRCTELHGGTITFTSREGEGTTFEVRLPLFPNHG
jgi:signal transduction histidine kinase